MSRRLTGLNRALVVKGLALMRARGRPGLAALFDVAGAGGPPTAQHLGFLIGPRINAGGRIGDAALGAKLLSHRDPLAAQQIAEELNRLNRERQTMEIATLEIAGRSFGGGRSAGEGAAIRRCRRGLASGRRRARRRALEGEVSPPGLRHCLRGGDIGTGSGRSITGVDLGKAVRAAVEAGIAVKGGGHAMAAGVTLAANELDAFRGFLRIASRNRWLPREPANRLLIDAR